MIPCIAAYSAVGAAYSLAAGCLLTLGAGALAASGWQVVLALATFAIGLAKAAVVFGLCTGRAWSFQAAWWLYFCLLPVGAPMAYPAEIATALGSAAAGVVGGLADFVILFALRHRRASLPSPAAVKG